MKAVVINKFGGPEVLEVVEADKPTPGPGQVLVKVHASCINPIDVKIAQGMISTLQFPFRLGTDMAGVVTEIGEGVSDFAVGNKIYGNAIALAGGTGAFAEFAVVPTEIIAPMPNRIDFNQAAASVLTGVSAIQALLEYMKLQSGQRILIHGGAGGIGTMAIQLAKHIGAYVATTATGEGVDFVKKLGAGKVIDYKTQNFEEVLPDFDAVFDMVGGQTYTDSFKVLKKGGVIVSMLMPENRKLAEEYGVTAVSQMTQVNTDRLNTLTKYMEDRIVKVHIDKIYTLDNIKAAFEEKEKGEALGKIVIQVN